MNKTLYILNTIAIVIVVIGCINWGFYAFNYNLVNKIFGSYPILEKIIYLLVTISGIYIAIILILVEYYRSKDPNNASNLNYIKYKRMLHGICSS
jgi:uncharacterized membrane protein YuzA (DUF378 family)